MKYAARKFVAQSYVDSDQYAKDMLCNFLIKRGHWIGKSKEDYYWDVESYKDNKIFLFEVEVKRNYPFTTRESFPFQTVSFLGRKHRLHKIQPFYYIIICKETGWAVTCFSSEIYKDEYIEELNIKTISRLGDDLMFRVPKSNCKFFKIDMND